MKLIVNYNLAAWLYPTTGCMMPGNGGANARSNAYNRGMNEVDNLNKKLSDFLPSKDWSGIIIQEL